MKEYGALLAAPDGAGRDGAGQDGTGQDGTGQDGTGAGWAARAAALSGKVRDLSEFLAELYGGSGGPQAERHQLPVRGAHHDPRPPAPAPRVPPQPRDLLPAIPRLELARGGDGATCRGSAGGGDTLQPQA